MKKFAAMLFCAMILLSGCGNNAQQKAEEVKQDATQKVEEVKQDTEKTVETVKQDATQKADEVKQDATQLAKDVLNIIDAAKSLFGESRDVPLAGVLPGIVIDKVIEVFGAPVTRDGDNLVFDNGMTISLDTVKNIVEKIIIRTPEISTPEGVAVGMDEDILNTAYGKADETDIESDGVEYKYFNKDKTRSITFTSQNGVITEIESEVRD